MKKTVSVLAIFLLVLKMLVTTGCSSDTEVHNEEVQAVYYINNAGTGLEPQAYELISTKTEDQIDELIGCLGMIPEKLEYQAPLQMGFSIRSYKIEGETLYLDVSEEYRSFQPTTEVLVRAALVRTFSQADGVRYVAITVEETPLYDATGVLVGLMSAEQFVDNAGNEINAYEKVKLKLYFANETGDALVATSRTVVYNTNIPLEKLVVEQLLIGPGETENGIFPTVNPDTKIVSVTVKDRVCYVNFNETFLTQIYTVTPQVAIYSIVNSLQELTNVNKVQITINGETDIMYRESISLNTVFERNLDLITTVK